MTRRRRKEKESLPMALINTHWSLAAGLSVGSLLVFQMLLPATFGRSPMLSMAAKGMAPFGWLLAGIFALCAFLSLLRQFLSRRTKSATEPAPTILAPEPHTIRRKEPVLPQPKPQVWSLSLLQTIDWKRFEEVVAAYFRAKGMRCETISHGPDGGVDARLYTPNGEKPMALVQCKSWRKKPVGVAQVRELLGVMTHEGVDRGFFMTTGEFSQDAVEFAESHRITLVTGFRFLEMLRLQTPEVQASLLQVATEGDYLVPTCASCGIKMVDREKFWGCVNFPKCRNKIYLAR